MHAQLLRYASHIPGGTQPLLYGYTPANWRVWRMVQATSMILFCYIYPLTLLFWSGCCIRAHTTIACITLTPQEHALRSTQTSAGWSHCAVFKRQDMLPTQSYLWHLSCSLVVKRLCCLQNVVRELQLSQHYTSGSPAASMSSQPLLPWLSYNLQHTASVSDQFPVYSYWKSHDVLCLWFSLHSNEMPVSPRLSS